MPIAIIASSSEAEARRARQRRISFPSDQEAGVDQAYCPYCGKEITVRGQTHCPHCGADIIDIWKLINSGLQPPPLVKPAPSRPHTLDWIGPAIVISLGLVLFLLALLVMVYGLPWLAGLIARFSPSGLNLVNSVALLSSQVAGIG